MLDPGNPPAENAQNEFRKNLSLPTVMALPLLALNHYDKIFTLIYLFIAVALLAYKDATYPLPSYALACEGIVLAMFGLTQGLRYVLAERAIAHKEGKNIVVYLIATVFVLLSLIFELRLQTYVVLAEVITNWTGIVFVVLEVPAALWVLKVLQHKKRGR